MALKITNQILIDEARSRGWKADAIDEAHSSYVVLYPPSQDHILIRSSITELSSAVGYAASNDKLATFDICQAFNLPVPETLFYDDAVPAEAFLEKHGTVVVKPADQNHGDGVTVGIQTTEQLHAAIAHSHELSENVIMQQQCSGRDHRFLVVGDQVKAVAYRQQPFVVGDGNRTVAELIEDKNTDPRRGDGHQSPLTKIDIEAVTAYIGAAHVSNVLADGERIQLLGTANLSKGGEAIDVTDSVHPELKAIAAKTAQLLQMGVCGVDIMTEDITKSPSESPAYIIETNVAPGIRMHHFPSEGVSRNVAADIIDEILRKRSA